MQLLLGALGRERFLRGPVFLPGCFNTADFETASKVQEKSVPGLVFQGLVPNQPSWFFIFFIRMASVWFLMIVSWNQEKRCL
jgi:hypothetical protein